MEFNHSKTVLRLRKYLNVDGIDDVVSTVELSFLASSLNIKGERIFAAETLGVDIFSTGEGLDMDNFTNFDNLTEEQVINWAMSKITPGQVKAIESILEDRLRDQYQVVDTEYIPWKNIDMNGKVITMRLTPDQVNNTPDEKVVIDGNN